MHLTIENFFRCLIVHPEQAATERDKKLATYLSHICRWISGGKINAYCRQQYEMRHKVTRGLTDPTKQGTTQKLNTVYAWLTRKKITSADLLKPGFFQSLYQNTSEEERIQYRKEICRLIKKVEIDVNTSVDGAQRNLLHLALSEGDIEFAKQLCRENRANPALKDAWGQNALHYVADWKDTDRHQLECIIHTLVWNPALAESSSLQIPTDSGSSILDPGVEKEHESALDQIDKEYDTPLWRAAKKGNATVMEIFLRSRYIDKEGTKGQKKSLLAAALQGENHDCINMALALDRREYQQDPASYLQLAVSCGHQPLCALLIQEIQGGTISKDALVSRDRKGNSLLALAATHSHIEIMKSLLALPETQEDIKNPSVLIGFLEAAIGDHQQQRTDSGRERQEVIDLALLYTDMGVFDQIDPKMISDPSLQRLYRNRQLQKAVTKLSQPECATDLPAKESIKEDIEKLIETGVSIDTDATTPLSPVVQPQLIPFHQAVISGNADLVDTFYQLGAEPTSTMSSSLQGFPRGSTPLHIAVRLYNDARLASDQHKINNYRKIIEMLCIYIKKSAQQLPILEEDIDMGRFQAEKDHLERAMIADENGDTPLSLAVAGKNEDCVRLFIDGAHMSAQAKNAYSRLLEVAFEKGTPSIRDRITDWLEGENQLKKAIEEREDSLFLLAAQQEDLLFCNRVVDLTMPAGSTVWHFAEKLIGSYEEQRTPLTEEQVKQQAHTEEILRTYLSRIAGEKESMINDASGSGQTPLLRAIEGSHPRALAFLVRQGASIVSQPGEISPLRKALSVAVNMPIPLKSQACIDILLESMKPEELEGELKQSPRCLFILSAQLGQYQLCETITRISSIGGSLWHAAVYFKHESDRSNSTDSADIMRIVEGPHLPLETINQLNEAGDTPLIMAIRVGDYELCYALCKKGASPVEKGRDGRTPLQVAVEAGQEQCAQILRQYIKE